MFGYGGSFQKDCRYYITFVRVMPFLGVFGLGKIHWLYIGD